MSRLSPAEDGDSHLLILHDQDEGSDRSPVRQTAGAFGARVLRLRSTMIGVS